MAIYRQWFFVFATRVSLLMICFNSGVALLSDSDLYPHTESEGCTKTLLGDDLAQYVRFTLNTFTYFQRRFSAAFISSNGILTFGTELTSGWLWMEKCNANNVTPVVEHRPAIMPFWADVDGREDTGRSQLLYKETQDELVLSKASADINSAFPGSSTTLTWAFIVTWKNVKQYSSRDTANRNTFQLVLASGGEKSYIIFYYQKITWYRAVDGTVSAAAGFVYNEGRNGYFLPGSCNHSDTYMLNLPEKSNFNQPGKWVFRVDSNDTSTSDIAPVATPLFGRLVGMPAATFRLEPSVVPIMGNVPIIIYGTRAPVNSNVNCLFRDPSRPRAVEVRGMVLPDRALICPVPFLHSLGKVGLSISVNGPSREPASYETAIYVVHQHEFSEIPIIHLNKTLNSSLWLSAQWNPLFLEMETIEQLDREYNRNENSRNNSNSTCEKSYHLVQIILLEFDGKKWIELGAITPPVINNGIHLQALNFSKIRGLLQGKDKILPRAFAIKGKYNLTSSTGVVEKLIVSNIDISTDMLIKELWKDEISQTSQTNKFDRICANWHDGEQSPVISDTLSCPKTVTQARLDWRFVVDKTSHLDSFYSNVSVTYVQRVASFSGASAQCAYNNEDKLMVDVGSLQRFSPNSQTNHWSHYWNDVMPFLYCCVWSFSNNWNCHNYYFDKRPRSISKYSPPAPARAIGNGHFTTFDGFTYTFNGAGEFWLVKNIDRSDDESHHIPSHFNMQIRMEPYSGGGELTNVSLITAAVMEEGWNGNDVKIQVNHESIKGFQVLIDGENINLKGQTGETGSHMFRSGFSIYHVGATISIQSQNQIFISFASGFSLNFMAAGLDVTGMNIILAASQKLMNKTEGLLGTFDGNMKNDLKSGSTTLPLGSPMERIHSDFGLRWLVLENETLFWYPSGKSYAAYCDLAFRPSFFAPIEDQDDESGCDGFEECIFDLMETENDVIAFETKTSFNLFEELLNVSKKEVKECKELQPPVNGQMVVTSYVVGSKLDVECKKGYVMQNGAGKTHFECKSESGSSSGAPQWIIPKTGESGWKIKFSCVPETGKTRLTSQKILSLQESTTVSVEFGKGFAVFVGLSIFIILVVVMIVEYPPCYPMKIFIVSKYRRYRQTYSVNDMTRLTPENDQI